ncbi:MAG: amino acid adenylation domain-containing protein [Cyanobacteria bacterium J06621_8]
MMNTVDNQHIKDFLQNLRSQEIELWVEGEKLRYRGKKEVLTPEILGQIKQYKSEILDFLGQNSEPDQPYPLSVGQQALWFLYQLAPESTAYNLEYAVRLQPDTDISLLRQAFSKLVARHPSLHTVYRTEQGQTVQEVCQDVPVQFQVTQTSDLSQEYLDQWLAENADLPFKLEQGDIIRAHVLERNAPTDSPEERECILLLVAHHIAVDFWSFDILMDELCLIYQSIQGGNPVALPTLTKNYQHFVEQEQEQLNSPEIEKHWEYWQQELAGNLPVINLPLDQPRPPVQTYNGACHYFSFSPEISQGIRNLAKQMGATPYTFVLTAFQIFLSRYTAQSEILLGCPMAGRNDPELEKIVGYFVNSVVIRGNLGGNPTFAELLPQVRRTLLEALDHQDLPFPLLVEKLQPKRDPSRSPIFQVDLIWDRSRPSESGAADIARKQLILDDIAIEQRGADLDLILTILDRENSLDCTWRYNTDMFYGDTIEGMAANFEALLGDIITAPERPIGELSILSAQEKHQLLEEWNDTEVDYPADKCLHQLFEEQVARTPNAVAIIFEEQKLTYRQVNARANQLASQLVELGVKPETLVGVCIERSPEMMIALLGILKAGGAYLPIDPNYPQSRISLVLEDSQVKFLVSQQAIASGLPQHKANVIYLEGNEQANSPETEEIPLSNIEVKPDNLAYIIYTSGSTGRPKGVQICHRNVVNLVSSFQRDPGVTPEDTILSATNISFDMSVLEIFIPLIAGAKLLIVSRQAAANGAELLENINKHQVTLMQGTPVTWRLLLAAGWQKSEQLRVFCGGESWDRELADQLQDKCGSLWNPYGPTETTVWSTKSRVKPSDVPIKIGRPIANTQVYVLDQNNQPVPIGVPGELHIGGAGVARGYFNRPELTAEKFIWHETLNARLYKTGDLVRYLRDGNLECLGRIDNQVKIRGFRIELGEIESLLSSFEKVQQAVVIAREDSPGDKRIVAYLVPASDSLTEAPLRQSLREKLPEYMVPSAFVLLDNLPLTPNGKVDRRSLPAPSQSKVEAGESFIAPQDELELQLKQVWEKVLGIHPIGVQDNFFALGGHSLLAILLFAQIEQLTSKKLPLAALFQAPTIKQLASLIRDDGWAPSWSSLVPIQPGGSKRPFFCVHGAGGHVLNYYSLSQHLSPERPFYALQAQGLDGELPFHTSIEEMAAHYIKEMRELQPEGPYCIGGYCGGGNIAWEMAQQLQAQGQEVGVLALFNTFNWAVSKHPFAVNSLPEKLYAKAKFIILDIGYHWGNLSLLKPQDKLTFMRERLRWAQRRLQTRFKAEGQMLPLASLHELHDRLIMEHVPQEYSGRLTIFQTRKLNDSDYDSRIGWSGLAKGGIEFHEIPAYFRGILVEPFVQSLAQQLEASLDRAEEK